MGKDKHAQRTKNNVRPSSSGRSAEMLGTAPLNPFMSFTSLKESMGVDEQMADSHLDPNFQVVLKKMNKKDGITKLKALQEFSQLCASSEPDQVVAILPFWPRLYSLLALDVEHRVREAAHVAHRSVVQKVKRNIAPYLKQLAGPWFVAQCDTYAPAASAASIAFNETFPPQKLSEAIAFCQEEILNYIYENLIVHTPQSLCTLKTMTPEEIEAKYIRTVTSSLQGYGLYLTRLTSDQLHSAEELNHKLVSDSKFWKFSKHQSPQVRSAWFGALVALCQHAQFLLSGEKKQVGLAVFGSLDESDAAVLPVVWEAALVSLVSINGLLQSVSFEKLVMPKLLRVCREGGRGSAAVIFPSLLPLLSKMPPEVVKDTTTFYAKFFTSVREGFSQRTVQLSSSESKAVASAFVECLQYVIQLNDANEDAGVDLLQKYMLPCICEALTSNKPPHARDALFLSVAKLLHSWGRSSEGSLQRKMLCTFCSDLTQTLKILALGDFPEGVSTVMDGTSNSERSETSCESTETEPSKFKKTVLKELLNSQVALVRCLLYKLNRNVKVKFADIKEQDSTGSVASDDGKNITSEVTNTEVAALGSALCCCYIQAISKSACVDYLPPLASFVKMLNSPSIYFDMARAVDLKNEHELFSKLLIKWMKPQNPLFCREAITLGVSFLPHLSTKDQEFLFDELLEAGLEPNQLLWIIEESLLSGDAASSWLRNTKLSSALKVMTEEASQSGKMDSSWELLSSGCSIANDGDYVFSHLALKDILDILVRNLEEGWHSNSTLPPWTSHAAKIMLKIYNEKSHFLRTLPSAQDPLIVAFEICLWEYKNSPAVETLSELWKTGTRILSQMHGPTSSAICSLCSSYVKAALSMLYSKTLHSKITLLHIASQFAEFLEIATNCFPSIDESQQRQKACSLLFSTLFSVYDDKVKDASSLQVIVALHRSGLEALADCVEPFHHGIDCSKPLPVGSQMELMGAAYWYTTAAFVLNKLFLNPLFDFLNDEDQGESFFMWDTYLDIFVLQCDVRCIATHFASTELGSALHQLLLDSEEINKQIISAIIPSRLLKFHELLLERLEKNAACERAHKAWHRFYSKDLAECDSNSLEALGNISFDDESLPKIDLSPLDIISDKLRKESSNEDVKQQAVRWLEIVYKLHINCNWRLLVSNNTIGSHPTAVVHDTLRIVKFLNSMVSCAPELLKGRNWDQVMIAMATWLHCAHETIMEAQLKRENSSFFSLKICAFIQGVCKLFVSFSQNIYKLQDGSIDLVDAERGSLKESLPREWRDVFSGECEHKIFAIWSEIVENIKVSEESPPIVALLDDLGQALQYSSTSFLQPSREAAVVYEPLLNYAPPFLLHRLGSVRLAAFHLLSKVIPHMVEHDAASLADIATEEGQDGEQASAKSEDRLSLLRFDEVLAHAQTVVSTMLSDVRLGTCCSVQPFTDSYTYTSGYLLVWSLMLDMCKAAETELKCQYAIWLKNASENYCETLMNNVFRLIPQEAFDEKLKKPLDYFTTRPSHSFGDYWSNVLVEHSACDVAFGALSCLPALTRQWWTNLEPKTATLIDKVVAKHLSPFLCTAEMAAVAKMQDKAVENMSVRVLPGVREVVATYTVDDLTMELVVRLPTNHPLTPMIVEVGRRNAAAAVQWRQWLMQLTMFLTHQNGSLWDGLALWRNNVVRRYEGVEECYICFCVLSGATYQLPKLSCRTCRKKFHSTCLYKWFQTSNKSTCPICRNLF